MDYENMTAQQFRDLGASRREEIYAKTMYVGSLKAEKILHDEYANLCADAASGDPVAEDLLAEWFRNGNQIIPENIDTSMRWLILAGANGNKYSLDRLKLHFGFAFDSIIDQDDFSEMASKYNIDEYNYQYVMGKFLCDAVVDDLKIDALALAKKEPTSLPFSSVVMRSFDRSITRAVDKVVELMRR